MENDLDKELIKSKQKTFELMCLNFVNEKRKKAHENAIKNYLELTKDIDENNEEDSDKKNDRVIDLC